MVICQVEDGSFIFASTEALLWKVLIQMDLMPDIIQTIPEFTYLEVRDGVITTMESLTRPLHTNDWDYGYYRHQTAGAKGSKPKGNPYAVAASPYDEWFDYNGSPYDPDDYWGYAISQAGGNPNQESEFVDFYGSPCTGTPEYYIKYVPTFVETPNDVSEITAWYPRYKYEDYEDDVNTIVRQPHDYKLLDYGVVLSDGTMVSDLAKDNVQCELF
jgi:hypothetical protein